jgi:hypothetical protein
MYIYTIQAMPGQKPKDDSPIKYRIKRVNTDIPTSGKGRSEFIRDNLDYDEATALIKSFNDMEGKSQDMRHEEAERKKSLQHDQLLADRERQAQKQ